MVNKKTICYIDGYNVINAWPELKREQSFDLMSARNKLNHYIEEYASYYNEEITIVYDAYMTKSRKAKNEKINNLNIIYTKKNQTADSYIEKIVNEVSKDIRITVKVVTSDWAIQRQTMGNGAIRMAPWELIDRYNRMKDSLDNMKTY